MGAPKGNKNALKNGLYAKHFTPEEWAGLQKMNPKDGTHEMYVLEAVIDDLFELHILETERVKALREAGQPVDLGRTVVLWSDEQGFDGYDLRCIDQSGGCCDGSAPMCFEEGELRVGSNDICLGIVGNCKFYMSADQFEYWKHTQLTLDVSPGRGSSFSLEIPLGIRFCIQSKLFTVEELENLEPLLAIAE